MKYFIYISLLNKTRSSYFMINIYIYIYIYSKSNMTTKFYIYIYIYISVCVYIYIYIYISVCVCVCVCARARTIFCSVSYLDNVSNMYHYLIRIVIIVDGYGDAHPHSQRERDQVMLIARSSLTLVIRPDHPSLLVGLLDCIQSLHRADLSPCLSANIAVTICP